MCQQLGTRLAVIDHIVEQDPLRKFALTGIPESEQVSELYIQSFLEYDVIPQLHSRISQYSILLFLV